MLNLFNISIFKSTSKCIGKLTASASLGCFSDQTVCNTPVNVTKHRRIAISAAKPTTKTRDNRSKIVKSFGPDRQAIQFMPDYTSTPKYLPTKTSTPETLSERTKKPQIQKLHAQIRKRKRHSKIRFNSRNSTFKDYEHTHTANVSDLNRYFVNSKQLTVIESQFSSRNKIIIKRIRTTTTSVFSPSCYIRKAEANYYQQHRCGSTFKKFI